jgi:Cu(I)/Ag(I) efflux system protein CusF
MRNVLLAAALTLAAGAASAQMNHGAMDHSAMTEGVHAEATLNAVSDEAVNVSHGPIPEIGWPAMTMDLPLLDGADLGGAAPGDTVMMMLDKGPDGLYGVKGMSRK